MARFLPFLEWFKGYTVHHFRLDFISGITVALVLVPQSMAYAQLAGLPAYYGLYAAFLPPLVASLFGSSRQLATGPVAVVSLMTATALEPLATAGSEMFVAYAILLALLVGLFQLLLGLLRLGLVVNFLSHPVVNGFTNAAALIIASSQLSKIFGVNVVQAEHQYETVYNILRAAWHFTHWPTLGLAILAFIIMYAFRRINPRIPYVLVAVAVSTVISWATGFEHNCTMKLGQIKSNEAVRA
ncbi:MAG: SulP family inorganic anion transporter, partial [Candidatus Zixiibacteriota bacterium]